MGIKQQPWVRVARMSRSAVGAFVLLPSLTIAVSGCREAPTESVSNLHAALEVKVSQPFDVERVPTDFRSNGAEKISVACDSVRCLLAHHLSFVDGAGWVLATRVDSAGKFVDTPRIQVTKGEWLVRVLARPGEFLVITSTDQTAEAAPYHFYRVRGADGLVTPVVGDGLPTTIPVRGAGNEDGWVLISPTAKSGVIGARAYNEKLEPLGSPVEYTGVMSLAQNPTPGPGQFLVGDYGQVIRIDSKTGKALDDPPIVLSKYLSSAGMRGIYADGIYQLVWGSPGAVVGSRLGAATGEVLDPDDTFNEMPTYKTIRAHSATATGAVDIDRIGSDIVVSFPMLDHSLQAVRVDPQSGLSTSPMPQSIQVLQNNNGAASTSELHAIGDTVLLEDSLRHLDIGKRLAAPGIARFVDPPLTPGLPAFERFKCRTAASSSGYLVVWAIGSSTYQQGSKIVATRVDPETGVYLDDPPLQIGTGEYPVVASDGTNYMVSWLATADATTRGYWRVVKPNGALGAAQYAKISDYVQGFDPSLTFNGDYYVAAFGQRAFRMQADGTVVSPATPLPSGSFMYDTGFQLTLGEPGPRVVADTAPALDRRTFLLVGETGTVQQPTVSARRLRSQTGALLEMTTVAGNHRSPFTATDGTNLLVVSLEVETKAWDGVFVDALTGTPVTGTKKQMLDSAAGTVDAVFYDGSGYGVVATDYAQGALAQTRLYRFDAQLNRSSEESSAQGTLLSDKRTLPDTDAATLSSKRGLLVFRKTDVARFSTAIKGVLFASDGSDPIVSTSGGSMGNTGGSTSAGGNGVGGTNSAGKTGSGTGGTSSAGAAGNGAEAGAAGNGAQAGANGHGSGGRISSGSGGTPGDDSGGADAAGAGGAATSGGDSPGVSGGKNSSAGASARGGQGAGNAATSGGAKVEGGTDGNGASSSGSGASEDSGCGCRLAGRRTSESQLSGLGLAAGLLLRRARRRRQQPFPKPPN
jgi:hypothetical protein